MNVETTTIICIKCNYEMSLERIYLNDKENVLSTIYKCGNCDMRIDKKVQVMNTEEM